MDNVLIQLGVTIKVYYLPIKTCLISKTFKIDIHNYGLSPAKHVVISVDSYRAKFVNMTSKPILPIIQNTSNKTGNQVTI